jgi:hypothetical protein
VEGRHKAGHDDGGVAAGKRTIDGNPLVVSCRPINSLIVMAGLVPAIHVFLVSSGSALRLNDEVLIMTEQMMASRTLNGVRALNDHGHLDRPPAEEMSQTDVAREGARDGPTPGIAALKRDPARLASLRREIEETTLSNAEIAKRFGLAPGSLHRLAVESGWRRPEGAPVASRRTRPTGPRLARTIDDGEAVTARLLRVVDRQIHTIDTRLRRKGAMIDEKDARLLVHLAKTLQTIMALGRDGGAGTKEPAERDQVDADLARRIALWAEGREEA